MLSSTLTITADTNTAENCQIYATENVTNKTRTTGRINANDITFSNCGKQGWGNAAVVIRNVQNNNAFGSSIVRSKFLKSGSAGVIISNTMNVQIAQNIFYQTVNNSIVISNLTKVLATKPITIDSNVMANNQQPAGSQAA
jgi:hypothetical protein